MEEFEAIGKAIVCSEPHPITLTRERLMHLISKALDDDPEHESVEVLFQEDEGGLAWDIRISSWERLKPEFE